MDRTDGPLAVLWEDPHGLAVVKPPGRLTQGIVEGEPTLESMVRHHLRPDDPASVYLGTVHRLDRPVSGVVLWAKTPKAARRWAEQFANRTVRKEYWAIVETGPDLARLGDSGTWEDQLTRPDSLGRARVVDHDGPDSVRALTRFERGHGRVVPDGLAWVRLFPETGRTHQLRAQAADRGTPIVGDATYGATRAFPAGIALHARRLVVDHPATHRPIVVEAPLPASWDGWLT